LAPVATLLAAACGWFGAGCADAPDPTSEAVVSARPAVALAPLVLLHPAEEYFPIGADRFIDRASVKWRVGHCLWLENVATGSIADSKTPDDVPRTDPGRLGGSRPAYRRRALDEGCRRRIGRQYSATELTRPYDPGARPPTLVEDDGFYLDLLSDSADGDPRYVRHGDGARVLVDEPAYYTSRRVAERGRTTLHVDYWLLYGHSETVDERGERILEHEGDWERVRLTLERAGRTRWRPIELGLGNSSDPLRRVPWSEVDVEGTHPVLYAARGSHRLHPAAGDWREGLRVGGAKRTGHHETATCDACSRWRTWARLRPLRREAWFGFGGGWGVAFETNSSSGPLGPWPRYIRRGR
jgi:hypothetical protein